MKKAKGQMWGGQWASSHVSVWEHGIMEDSQAQIKKACTNHCKSSGSCQCVIKCRRGSKIISDLCIRLTMYHAVHLRYLVIVRNWHQLETGLALFTDLSLSNSLFNIAQCLILMML